jgi:prephenate dehydrogenase
VLLAAPVEQNLRLLSEVAEHLGSDALITDVGGTKRGIVKAAAGLSGSGPAFVGGHPIGGSERGGFAFARADLFRGRPWILTPAASIAAGRVERLAGFIQSLGAKPTLMDADEHDRLMAFLSHLPQLTVSALMEVVGDATASSGLRLAGRGLMDSTRLASSPADVWRDVCASNASDIGAALDLLIARLQQLRSGLADAETVDTVFGRAAHWRFELMKGRE